MNNDIALHSLEAEKALIGACLIDTDMIDAVLTMVAASDFYLLRNSIIFSTMVNLSMASDTIDPVTIYESIASKHGADMAQDLYLYLINCSSETPTSQHAPAYAKLIRTMAERRELLALGDKIKASAVNVDVPFSEATQDIRALLDNHIESETVKSIGEMVNPLSELIQKRRELLRKNPQYIIGVQTGYKDLDQMIGGLQAGLIILGASTGMGKSAFVQNIASNASLFGINNLQKRPANVVMFCGEMTEEQIMLRLVSMKSSINANKIKRGYLTKDELPQVNEAMMQMLNHNLHFESAKSLNANMVHSTLKRMQALGTPCDLYIIDGISEMVDTVKRGSHTDLRITIANILNALESISMEFNIPILITAQLNRASADRQDKRPRMSDLAEASFLERKASTILFMYRDEMYDEDTPDKGITEILVRKNRLEGTLGTVRLAFNAETITFNSTSKESLGD